ncbi:MAG: hypothetical protein GX299_10640 [Epulopiscium sp.]|nr:hypothetical protein [Candidatus Epulonipiscium sp.]
MNRIKGKTIQYTLFAMIGVTIFILSEVFHFIDTFWSGLGVGFVIISVIRLIQLYRYQNDNDYAEKINIQNSDERNKFIADKARSMTFYYSILIAAILTIVLRVLGYYQESSILGYTICIQLVIYWLSYLWLKRKY